MSSANTYLVLRPASQVLRLVLIFLLDIEIQLSYAYTDIFLQVLRLVFHPFLFNSFAPFLFKHFIFSFILSSFAPLFSRVIGYIFLELVSLFLLFPFHLSHTVSLTLVPRLTGHNFGPASQINTLPHPCFHFSSLSFLFSFYFSSFISFSSVNSKPQVTVDGVTKGP